jgi:hypothetical protein
VRDDARRYADKNVLVFGINGGSADSHGATREFGPFKLVTRTVVGIDRQGRIVFYKRGIPSTDEILAAF